MYSPHPGIIAVQPSTIFDLQSSYFLSKFPPRPRWVTNVAKTSHSSVMTRAHHYRIITPVTRCSEVTIVRVFRLRGKGSELSSDAAANEGIAPEWRVGVEETILNTRGATWRSEEASFLASPPFDRGYYVKRRVPFWNGRIRHARGSRARIRVLRVARAQARADDRTRYRAQQGLVISSWKTSGSHGARANNNSLRNDLRNSTIKLYKRWFHVCRFRLDFSTLVNLWLVYMYRKMFN